MDEKSIFLQALEKPAGAQRAIWLAEICGSDSRLRERIEALLRRHEQAKSFLEQPATALGGDERPIVRDRDLGPLDAGLTAAFHADEAVVVGDARHLALRTVAGQLPGPAPVALRDQPEDPADAVARPQSTEVPRTQPGIRYQLHGEIARGGMGAILKGRDLDLGRDLAIKVLLDAHRDKPQVVERFIEEAQIGGQLQHPGIVPVYELGQFAEGRPFFSMKLVKGKTLGGMLAARPDPATERSKFLGIFAQVCQTMAYAHSRGVIHRDLKPANVMVGLFGEVQVMDWGLAKVLPTGGVAVAHTAAASHPDPSVIRTLRSAAADDTPGGGSNTHLGSVMGTPAYMPPEQALGRVDRLDERADVFSLGAILCETLTGRPPYVGQDGEEIYRQASRGKLEDCFAKLAECGAEQELVVLARECLAAEPEARPRDAGHVAERITGYLASVETRLRAAEIERASETARAEEALKTAAQESLARSEAQARASAERRRRQVTLALAAAVVALLVVGGGGAFWLAQEHQERLAGVGQSLAAVAALRDNARGDKATLPGWREALAAADQAVQSAGELLATEPGRQLASLREALAAEVEAAQRDATLIAELTATRAAAIDLGDSGMDLGFAAALREYGLDVDTMTTDQTATRLRERPAAVIREVVGVLDHWALIRRTLKFEVPRVRTLLELAGALDPDPLHNEIRRYLLQVDLPANHPDLLALAESASARELSVPGSMILVQVLSAAGESAASLAILRDSASNHPEDVWANFKLGEALTIAQPPLIDEAIRFYAIARSLRPETAHALAHLLDRSGRIAEAQAVFRDLSRRRPDDGYHLACYGAHLHEQGQQAEAESLYERAIAVFRERVAREPNDGLEHAGLGYSLYLRGMLGEAANALHQALLLEPKLAVAHGNLGVTLCGQGSLREGLDSLREAARLDRQNPDMHFNLGRTLGDVGLPEESIAEYRAAIALDPGHYRSYSNLGIALAKKGERDEALTALHEATRLRPGAAEAHSSLGHGLYALGQFEKAVEAYHESIRLNPTREKTEYWCGNALYNLRRFEEAATHYQAATRINPEFADAHYYLGNCFANTQRYEAAAAAYREAIRHNPQHDKAHANLGTTLVNLGQITEALVECREAIRLDPESPGSRESLADTLLAAGQLDEAISQFRESLRLEPRNPNALVQLGIGLFRSGRVDEAIAEYNNALDLSPNHVVAYGNLGDALTAHGKLAESLAAYRRAAELAGPETPIGAFARQRIVALESQLAVLGRLPAILKREVEPASAPEAIALALAAYEQQHYAGSARLFAWAFNAEPSLLTDLAAQHAYNAACSAALAGCGKGVDEPPPVDAAKAALRTQALEWLQSQLAVWKQHIDLDKPETQVVVAQTLGHWQNDSDLAGIRDVAALAQLPGEERAALSKLWADVAELLTQAQAADYPH